MKRSALLWTTLAALGLLLGACSDQNASLTQAHPAGWILAHGGDPGAAGRAADCGACHGAALEGGSAGIACLDCHMDGPPFAIHADAWVADPVIAHLAFAEDFSWTTCATGACHGADLKGGHGSGETGPSCFSSDALGCHPGGPPAPHAGNFFDPTLHGPLAKNTQLVCRNCHGVPQNTFNGGFVFDPAILDNGLGNCSVEFCHPAATAHPTNWQGSNDEGDTDQAPGYGSTHRTIASEAIGESCVLCHNTTAAGSGLLPGAPSCFSAGFTNANGSTTGCHADGPGSVPHDLPFVSPGDHGPVARGDGTPESGQAFCQTCHGNPGSTEFAGGLADTACSQTACHPASGAHPTSWQGNNDTTLDYISSHQGVDLVTVAANCVICHNTTQAGAGPNPASPSCFSSSFSNPDGKTSGCHAEGPGTPSHELPFDEPASHGPVAKGNGTTESGQAFCQTCHGTPGSTAFDGGVTGVGCSVCHPDADAHPTNWQGTNDDTTTSGYASSHRDSGDFDSCSICHNTEQAGAGPNPAAPSCFSSGFSNAAGSTTACHPTGPGAPHALGASWLDPTGHGPFAKGNGTTESGLAYCQTCHGTPDTILFDGGSATTACSQALCHPDAGAHPTSWQGTNGATTHRTAGDLTTSCIICHDGPTVAGTGANPAAPSCFSTDFTNADAILSGCHPTGPGRGHQPFTGGDLVLHQAEAKNDLAYCQQCHADPFNGGPGSNPRFNVALGALTGGCETCHNPNTAHPVPWVSGRVSDHMEFGNKENVCVLCHGIDLQGAADTPAGVGTACGTCHTAGLPVATPAFPTPLDLCTSCHGTTASPAPAGVARPDREGAHTEHTALQGLIPQPGGVLTCNTACHDGAGSGQATHYDEIAPADVSILSTYAANSGTPIRNGDGSCSNVSCHGGQTTQPWLSGVVDVNADCASCHEVGTAAGSPEANSYFSGNHGTHAVASGYAAGLGFTPTCSACHDAAALAPDHFVALETSRFEGDPVGTLDADLGYVTDPTSPTCTIGVGGALDTAGCHTGTRTWGGVPHIVGQQWLLPSEHAQSSISGTLDCLAAGCHTMTAAEGGVSPACRECHTGSDPQGDVNVCTSCHGEPPNLNSTALAARPNRRGEHLRGDHSSFIANCTNCHPAAGSGSGQLQHYDRVGDQGVQPDYPAEVELNIPGQPSATYNSGSSTCSNLVGCHGTESWY